MSAIMREALEHLARVTGRTGAQALLAFANEHPQPGAAQVGIDHDEHLGDGNW